MALFFNPSFAFCAASCPNCRIVKVMELCWAFVTGFGSSSTALGASAAGFEAGAGAFGGSGAAGAGGGILSFIMA